MLDAFDFKLEYARILAVHLVEEEPRGGKWRLDLVYPELRVLGTIVALHSELVAFAHRLLCNRARHGERDSSLQKRGFVDDFVEIARFVERLQRLSDALPEQCASSVFQDKRQDQNRHEREVDEKDRVGGHAEHDEHEGDEGDDSAGKRKNRRLVPQEGSHREPWHVMRVHGPLTP